MAENENELDGVDVPPKMRRVIETAPPAIRKLLTKALVDGQRVQFIEFDKPGVAEPSVKDLKGKHPLENALLSSLTESIGSLEMLKHAVTSCLEEHAPICRTCAKIVRTTKPGELVVAPCLADMTSAPDVLMKGFLRLTERWTPERKRAFIDKIMKKKEEG